MEFSTVLNDLSEVIASRKTNPDGEKSYVASLLTKGLEKISAKVMEEASEAVEAARSSTETGREHLTREVADLVFHALVLLGYRDLRWENVEVELRRRFGIGGHQEKASRGDDLGATEKATIATNVLGPPERDGADNSAAAEDESDVNEQAAFLSVLVPGDEEDTEAIAPGIEIGGLGETANRVARKSSRHDNRRSSPQQFQRDLAADQESPAGHQSDPTRQVARLLALPPEQISAIPAAPSITRVRRFITTLAGIASRRGRRGRKVRLLRRFVEGGRRPRRGGSLLSATAPHRPLDRLDQAIRFGSHLGQGSELLGGFVEKSLRNGGQTAQRLHGVS